MICTSLLVTIMITILYHSNIILRFVSVWWETLAERISLEIAEPLFLLSQIHSVFSTGSQKQPEWGGSSAGHPQRKGQQLLCWLQCSKWVTCNKSFSITHFNQWLGSLGTFTVSSCFLFFNRPRVSSRTMTFILPYFNFCRSSDACAIDDISWNLS